MRSPVSPARLLALGATLCLISGCTSSPQSFNTPDEAVNAMVGALKPLNTDELLKIFGSEGEEIIYSGDPIADANGAERFLEAYQQKHELITLDEQTRSLQVGTDDWPFPVPLIETEDGTWSFDAEAGRDEIINRRVGANELNTIQVCLAIVDAQRDFVLLDPDGNSVHEYTSRFFSEPGKRNGLYWEAAEGETPSPLGLLVAEASEEGYQVSPAGPTPYHGYYFRILSAQGPHAEGGAYDYVINGRTLGGFGVVAWPATYQNSGVMTFITNHDGVVYQKDLGEETADLARKMWAFEPDAGWVKVE